MNILVTGGAGFIGSHLIDALINEGHHVVCADDLSLGKEENILHHKDNPGFQFIKTDICDTSSLDQIFKKYFFEHVFHLAANSDIPEGTADVMVDFNKTFMTTFSLLKCMTSNNVNNILFASSSAVYGDLPGKLGEETGPLEPISFYGAAKLSSEAYIAAFSHTLDNAKAWIFRFPNVVGERMTHGVIFDFLKKLKKTPSKLTILGDGQQEKPYLYVKDVVDAMMFTWKNAQEQINYFNLGVDNRTKVKTIADIVVNELGLKDVEYVFTGSSRGWPGDVPRFEYNLSKINRLGWTAKRSSDEAIRLAVRAELENRKKAK